MDQFLYLLTKSLQVWFNNCDSLKLKKANQKPKLLEPLYSQKEPRYIEEKIKVDKTQLLNYTGDIANMLNRLLVDLNSRMKIYEDHWFYNAEKRCEFNELCNKIYHLQNLAKFSDSYNEKQNDYRKRFLKLCFEKSNKNNTPPIAAIIGEFSCGKSKFINSLLGTDIQKDGINPTTHTLTEFSYGKAICIKDDNGNQYNLEDYKQLQNEIYSLESHENSTKYYYITYNNEFLKNVILLDTPGWNAPSQDITTNDDILSKEAVEKADIIFFLIDINEHINNEAVEEIIKIKKDKDFYIIFTHSDKVYDDYDFNSEIPKKHPKKKELIKILSLKEESIMFYSSMPKFSDEPYVIKTKEQIKSIIKEKSLFLADKYTKDLNEQREQFVSKYLDFIGDFLFKIPAKMRSYIDTMYISNSNDIKKLIHCMGNDCNDIYKILFPERN